MFYSKTGKFVCVRALMKGETRDDALVLASLAARRGGIGQERISRLADAIIEMSRLEAVWEGIFDESYRGAVKEFASAVEDVDSGKGQMGGGSDSGRGKGDARAAAEAE